jgi:hypothetical protein
MVGIKKISDDIKENDNIGRPDIVDDVYNTFNLVKKELAYSS